jgi:hypothetical protein
MIINSISARAELEILSDINAAQKTLSWLYHMKSIVKCRYAYLIECSEEEDNIDAMSIELELELSFFEIPLDDISQLLRRLRHELLNGATRPFSLEVANQQNFMNIPDPLTFSIDEALSFWD